ncbi:MAG TPA: NYN domain-containing protein [Acidimicrobiia bacterium]
MAELLVDGMNVIGSRPDGWWRDRDGAARRLLARLQALVAATGDAVTLVLDGRPLPGLAEGVHAGVDVRYARRPGRDAGDDRLVELLEAAPDPTVVRVVTSDRALRRQVGALGAAVEGAGALLIRLDELGDG